MKNEHAPTPQVFVSKDKIVTFHQCGPIRMYTEVCNQTGKVTTTTYIKTTP
jgi:hypothetical protein